ncbi:MAG: antitoxin [Gammaproteobacteria bacterium]|nr:antitoxin [Gammaproteobacteria bacterium]
MNKPATFAGYDDQYTRDCERVLVTLLRGLGPWKESVYLIGGLTPRYLIADRSSAAPPHAGTLDVDIVIDLQILADTAGYQTLEQNLRRMGFERAVNEQGQKLSWRWQTRTELGALMQVELLADASESAGGRVEPLPTKGNISALNIPHSSIVFYLHQVSKIEAELLGRGGIAVEYVKHANLVSFTCLKALAFDQRFEPKDAYDLVYCIEHASEGLNSAAEMFRDALLGRHALVIRECLSILRSRFASEENIEGYRKDGPVAVARFEGHDGAAAHQREARILRQRVVSNLVDQLLKSIA